MRDLALILDPQRALDVVFALGFATTVGGGLIVLTLLGLRVYRKASADAGHQLVLLSLLSLATLPFAAPTAQDVGLVDSAAATAIDASGHERFTLGAAGKFEDPRVAKPAGDPAPRVGSGELIQTALLVVWLVGASVLAVRLIWRLVGVALFYRQCRPVVDREWHRILDGARAELGIQSRVLLLSHPRVASPMIWERPRPSS